MLMPQEIVRALACAGDLLTKLSGVPETDKEGLESFAAQYLSIIQVCSYTCCCTCSKPRMGHQPSRMYASLAHCERYELKRIVVHLQDTQDRLLKTAEKLSHLIPDERNTYTSNVQVRFLQ